jgi:hypothetical protein
VPAKPYEWRGDAKHPLPTVIWYPADPGAEEKQRLLGQPRCSMAGAPPPMRHSRRRQPNSR